MGNVVNISICLLQYRGVSVLSPELQFVRMWVFPGLPVILGENKNVEGYLPFRFFAIRLDNGMIKSEVLFIRHLFVFHSTIYIGFKDQEVQAIDANYAINSSACRGKQIRLLVAIEDK